MIEIKDLSSYFKGPLDKLLGFVGSELKQTFSNRLIEYQREEYKRNYFSKTILHRTAPKSLSEFYQPLYIRWTGDHSGQPAQRISTHSVKKLFQNRSKITLIGTAGSGKSTIVKYLFTNCFTEQFKIPIKIELRYLNDYAGSINDYIFKEIFQFHKLGVTDEIIDRLLNSGDFIFFLDGFDEIKLAKKPSITKDIDSFVTKYSDNKYLITSRPYTDADLLPLFLNFNVCELQQSEISSFIEKQIPSSETELARKIINSVKNSNTYESFLKNPLLLSMYILTFQSYSSVPAKRCEFYDQVFNTLFSIHDSVSKLSFVREKQSGLSKDQFEITLQLFSFISFFEDMFNFSEKYLNDTLNKIKAKKSNLTFDNDKIISDLKVAIGILNNEGLDYTFPHRSLQEYFAALYISNITDANKIIFYRQLYQRIINNLMIISSKSHFFGLLGELDYDSLATNIIIPMLERIYQDVQQTTTNDKSSAFNNYGKLVITMRPFLILSSEGQKLMNEMEVNRDFVILGMKPYGYDYPSDYYNTLPGKEAMGLFKKSIDRFKSDGRAFIDALRNSIQANEDSDTNIIKMIEPS